MWRAIAGTALDKNMSHLSVAGTLSSSLEGLRGNNSNNNHDDDEDDYYSYSNSSDPSSVSAPPPGGHRTSQRVP